jgi:hypothetical protein
LGLAKSELSTSDSVVAAVRSGSAERGLECA